MDRLSQHISNRRFASLLNQRGIKFWTEDELDNVITVRSKRPDFYAEIPGYGPILVEVESFENDKGLAGHSLGAGGSDARPSLRRLRTAIKHAAAQLKPYAKMGIPMLVVLDNWRLLRIPSNEGYLRGAMFGSLEFRFHFSPQIGKRVSDPYFHHGGGQTLTCDRKGYISAVAWNLPKRSFANAGIQTEAPMRLRLIHNDFALVPIPETIFRDQEDEQYSYRGSRFMKVWPEASLTYGSAAGAAAMHHD